MFQRAGIPLARASAMKRVWKSVQFPLPTFRQYGMSPSPHPGTLLSYCMWSKTQS